MRTIWSKAFGLLLGVLLSGLSISPALADDRVQFYFGESPTSTMLNVSQNDQRIAMGIIRANLLSTHAAGLVANAAVTPGGGLAVVVGPNAAHVDLALYQMGVVDTNNLGTSTAALPPNPLQIMLQGLRSTSQSLNLPLTASGGNSQYFLIEAQVTTIDVNSITATFLSTGGTLTSAAVLRDRVDTVVYQVVAGTAAPSPSVPSADSGWVGVAKVLLASGATFVPGGNITLLNTMQGTVLNGDTPNLVGTNFTLIPNAALINSTISGVALGGSLSNLSAGTHFTQGAYNGSAPVTLALDATSANTVSTIVARDSSGDFNAHSATLTGGLGVTGTVTAGHFSGVGDLLTGIPNSALTNSSITVAGTTNQVNASGCGPVSLGNTCTLSLPQSINSGAAPNFLGTNFSVIPNSALSNSTVSGVALGGTLANLSAGTHFTQSAYNGSTARTLTLDATSADTVSTIVARDSSGDFTARNVSADGYLFASAAIEGLVHISDMTGDAVPGGYNIASTGDAYKFHSGSVFTGGDGEDQRIGLSNHTMWFKSLTPAGHGNGTYAWYAGNVATAPVLTLDGSGNVVATGAFTGTQFNGSGAGLTSIPNSALNNSSITVAGTANQVNVSGCGPVSLGGTCTLSLPAAPTIAGTNITVLPANAFASSSFTSGRCLQASSATAIGSAATACPVLNADNNWSASQTINGSISVTGDNAMTAFGDSFKIGGVVVLTATASNTKIFPSSSGGNVYFESFAGVDNVHFLDNGDVTLDRGNLKLTSTTGKIYIGGGQAVYGDGSNSTIIQNYGTGGNVVIKNAIGGTLATFTGDTGAMVMPWSATFGGNNPTAPNLGVAPISGTSGTTNSGIGNSGIRLNRPDGTTWNGITFMGYAVYHTGLYTKPADDAVYLGHGGGSWTDDAKFTSGNAAFFGNLNFDKGVTGTNLQVGAGVNIMHSDATTPNNLYISSPGASGDIHFYKNAFGTSLSLVSGTDGSYNVGSTILGPTSLYENGTVQGSSNGSTVSYIGPTYTAAGAAVASTWHEAFVTCTTSSSTHCTVTLTGAAVFASSTSYVCTGMATVGGIVYGANASGSSTELWNEFTNGNYTHIAVCRGT